MPSLIVTTGPNKGDYYPIAEGASVSIGRLAECTVQLVDDSVSRKHCVLSFDRGAGRYAVEDQGSSNGTEVNGERLEGLTHIDDGAMIGCGDSGVLFTLREFPDKESALTDQHLKRWFGEDERSTMY